jgi:arginyl-tRNA synthetase
MKPVETLITNTGGPMKKLLDLLSNQVGQAFEKAGYDHELGWVTVSNRPDLCEFQCNGSLAGAKRYHKPPMVIAGEVMEYCQDSDIWESVEAVTPGFLNLKLSETYLTEYLKQMEGDICFGVERPEKPKMVMVDYGGANVAKPLHVGHIRSAVIGESLKRLYRFAGNKVLGDVHLGDWGLQMGLVIVELQDRQPSLPYFREDYTGAYPTEPPFTISQLEEIYPTASAKSKKDEVFKAKAMEATFKLQNGHKGYRALWKHIMKVSIEDLKKNYSNLQVDFDLWKGESDVQDLIPDLVSYLKEEGYAYESNGALVVDVKQDSDTKEIPPCIILKSDGASLYTTTDLATILERMNQYHPDLMIYTTDKRQELHFEQVFRCARKTHLVPESTRLRFLGFGTMNGKDGKPYKTRDGGVMRLSDLIQDTEVEMLKKISSNPDIPPEEAGSIAKIVALAALKYGDLSNQASKDYIFDIEKFTSFEGDTGPYILYTIVRIKSILNKYKEAGGNLAEVKLSPGGNPAQKDLMLQLTRFNGVVESACQELAPHKICAYVYELANALNHFYHATKILTEEDHMKKTGMIALLILTKEIMETCIDLLGFTAPERM